MNNNYIDPRKKLPNKEDKREETREYTLCRRLEEYIEYAHARSIYSDVAFYEELLKFIEGDQ